MNLHPYFRTAFSGREFTEGWPVGKILPLMTDYSSTSSYRSGLRTSQNARLITREEKAREAFVEAKRSDDDKNLSHAERKEYGDPSQT